MKQSENNQIDLLLRKMAKSDSVSEGPGTHLDADELNSFAEGVLPPATRSLYAAHLADCTRCRRLVAELAKGSGVGVRSVSSEESSRTIWSYLAGLFRPTVLRYAVPALSLVILAGVAWIWMQQRREASFVAQSNTGIAATAPSEVGVNKQVTVEEQVKESSRRQGAVNSDSAHDKSAAVSQERSNTAKEADGDASAAGAKKKEEAKSTVSETAASPAADRAYSPPPPAPAKAQPAEPTDSPALAREEVAKQRPQSKTAVTDVAQQSEDEAGARRDKNEAVARRKAEARKAPEGRGLTVGGGFSKNDQSATRTVGGRRFRRENDVWVDTAYSSSTPLTQIPRGSEQYRALMGDEPGLRTIAEELDGEVIVVWKGKAYRIR